MLCCFIEAGNLPSIPEKNHRISTCNAVHFPNSFSQVPSPELIGISAFLVLKIFINSASVCMNIASFSNLQIDAVMQNTALPLDYINYRYILIHLLYCNSP